jgi:type I restriction enzyme S subunit
MTQQIALGEVATINPHTPIHFGVDELCSFVPMDAVDEATAEISKFRTRPYKEVARGYTSFTENDVLLAKITPCMENGKCAIARGLHNGIGFGSTEFHVVRGSSQILPEWIYYYWRLPKTRRVAERNMTGTAGQRRVPASFMENLVIPCPLVAEQRRLIHLLQIADKLRRIHRCALRLCDEFLPAAFNEFFGDLKETASHFQQNALDELIASTQLGIVRGAAAMHPDFEYAYLRMDSILGDGRVDFSDLRRVQATPKEVKDFSLYSGDFIFNTRNTRELVGKTGLVTSPPEHCLFNNNIMRIRFHDAVRPEFMISLFQSPWLKNNLERIKSGTTNVFAIYYKELADLPVVVPPLPLQQKFTALVQRHRQLRLAQEESFRQADHLFQTLLHQAFAN